MESPAYTILLIIAGVLCVAGIIANTANRPESFAIEKLHGIEVFKRAGMYYVVPQTPIEFDRNAEKLLDKDG